MISKHPRSPEGAWLDPANGTFRLLDHRGAWFEPGGPPLGLAPAVLEALPKAGWAREAEAVMRAYARGLVRLRVTHDHGFLEIDGAQATVSPETAFRAAGKLLDSLGLEEGVARYDQWDAEFRSIRSGTLTLVDRHAPLLEPAPAFEWATTRIEVPEALPATGTFPLLLDGRPGIGEILHRSARDLSVRLLEPVRTQAHFSHIPYFAAGHVSFLGSRGDATARGLLRQLVELVLNREALVASLRPDYRNMREGRTYQAEREQLRRTHKAYETASFSLEREGLLRLPEQALGQRETVLGWLEEDFQ